MVVQGECSGAGCCYPIALCNALEFYGKPHPLPGTPDWEVLVEVARCRHGSALNRGGIQRYLGVVSVSVDRTWLTEGDRFPLVVSVQDPELGFHAILATQRMDGMVFVENYRGEPGQWVEIGELKFADREVYPGVTSPAYEWIVLPFGDK